MGEIEIQATTAEETAEKTTSVILQIVEKFSIFPNEPLFFMPCSLYSFYISREDKLNESVLNNVNKNFDWQLKETPLAVFKE